VQQINSDATSISKLNAQIVISSAEAGGQPPNDLIDQRDQLVTNLSKLTGITTSVDGNGSLNVFVGNGQPLVLQGNTTQLTTIPNPFNASQLEISTSTSNGHPISDSITAGDLGGLLAARSTVVNPAINQLGQIATAFAQSANQQQNAGADISGNLGAALFSVAGPKVTASTKNTDFSTVTATVTVPSVGGLTANDYVLAYQNGAYSLTNTTDGSVLTPSGSGTAASPLVASGLSIVLSSAPPAAGDQFLIQPTRQAAGSFSAALTNPSQIAAAGITLTSAAAGTNAGSGTIGSATVQNATTALTPTSTINFTSSTTYTVSGVTGSNTYTPGSPITQNGWKVIISGTPAAGDSFTVQFTALPTGDNSNALANANLQTQKVLNNGTASVNDAVSALVTGVGSQAQQINTAQTAQAAVNTQAVANLQSVSGVNLDEEAASLLQWQQAYGAAAKALQIASGLFTNLLSALNAA
jgi:flagellar hook-associated protein 1 FlgK